MKEYNAAEAAEILAKQIAALSRYRHVVEAQRAVMRMEDAGLLEVFTAEADGIFADISAREVQLMSIRAAAQTSGGAMKSDSRIAELHAELDRERARTAATAANVIGEMQGQAGRVATEIRAASDQVESLVHSYRPGWDAPGPSRIDRRG